MILPRFGASSNTTPLTRSSFASKAGLLMVVNNHNHGGENTMALNSQDGYPRKLIIACPDEKTHESRIEYLTKVKEVRNKIEQSFCNCLLSFSRLSHQFSISLFLLSNRKWSTQKQQVQICLHQHC
jgi:hypothetical protein